MPRQVKESSLWALAERQSDIGNRGYVEITRHVLREMYEEAFEAGRLEGKIEGVDIAFGVLSTVLQSINIREEVRRATSTQGQDSEGTQSLGAGSCDMAAGNPGLGRRE